MTDIVDRLRKASVYEEYMGIVSNLGDEAADEIERLREESKELNTTIRQSNSLIGKMAATIKKLKGAP